jgi:hypothetical protein
MSFEVYSELIKFFFFNMAIIGLMLVVIVLCQWRWTCWLPLWTYSSWRTNNCTSLGIFCSQQVFIYIIPQWPSHATILHATLCHATTLHHTTYHNTPCHATNLHYTICNNTPSHTMPCIYLTPTTHYTTRHATMHHVK